MKNILTRFLKYPLYPRPLSSLEKVMVTLHFGGFAKCNICGWFTPLYLKNASFRESCKCFRCRSTNRQRQLAYTLCKAVGAMKGQSFSSLKKLAETDKNDLIIYNTEANGAFHRYLSKAKNYISSEYFGSFYTSGELVNGVMHQDLMKMSLADESLDIFITSDVLEHVPEPYQAHREIYRVLKPGGIHIFAVPFNPDEFLDDHRAVLNDDGTITYFKEPVYHGDPLNMAKGILVYNLFSLEMLVKLRQIGFRTHLYQLQQRFYGIFGPDTLIFEAIKEAPVDS